MITLLRVQMMMIAVVATFVLQVSCLEALIVIGTWALLGEEALTTTKAGTLPVIQFLIIVNVDVLDSFLLGRVLLPIQALTLLGHYNNPLFGAISLQLLCKLCALVAGLHL